jgi:hypothetical protein
MLHLWSFNRFILISLALLGLSVSAANASTVYSVDRTVGNGSVSGFIETDGTIGILEKNNITDWELTLTVLGLSDKIELGRQSEHKIVGDAVEATATQLWFDFDVKNSANYILFLGTNPKNFWCLETMNCAGPSLAETISLSDSRSQVPQSGRIAFAQVSAIPVPAAVWLFGTALIGLVGFSKRRKAA